MTRTPSSPPPDRPTPQERIRYSHAVDLPRRPLAEWADRYRVAAAPFAMGGMGAVWAARDLDLDRDVAVKSIRLDLLGNREVLARFSREVRILARLDHPGICPIHDSFLADDIPCCTMKFVRGETLSEYIRKFPAPTTAREVRDEIRRRLGFVVRICETLHYAHRQGVIHRDLKPENVLHGAFGEIFVMDWGLARVLDEIDSTYNSPTSTGAMRVSERRKGVEGERLGRAQLSMPSSVLGTPAYLPPEFARAGAHAANERSDVFGIGGILLELLTGSPPWGLKTADDALDLARRTDVAIPSRSCFDTELPRELQGILKKSLATIPLQRYASAAQLAADIESFLADEPVSAVRDRLVDRVIKAARRYPARIIGAGSAVMLALVAAVLGMLLWNSWAEEKLKDALAREEQAKRKEEQAARVAAELQKAMTEERYSDAAAMLGVSVRVVRDKSATEFKAKWDAATAAGRSQGEFFNSLSLETIEGYLAAFERLFDTHAKHPGAVAITADDYFHRGLILGALHDRMRDQSPDTAKVYLRRAIDDFSEMFRRDPTDHTGPKNRGTAKFKGGDYVGAVADFTESLRLEPDDAVTLGNRGLAYNNLGQREKALADYNAALVLDPANARTLSIRGDIYRAMGDYTRALADYNEAIRINPKFADAFQGRGITKADQRDFEGAERDFDAAIQIDPNDPQFHLNRGVVRSNLKKYEAAIGDLDESIRLRPQFSRAYLSRGICRLNLDRRNDALADFDAALALDPNDWEPWRHRAVVLWELDKLAEGKRSLQRAIDLCPPNHRESLRAMMGELFPD